MLRAEKVLPGLAAAALLLCAACATAAAQGSRRAAAAGDEEFGPIVRSYLSYLRDQQEVVDDRVSRREVDRKYYLHNSNRIRALREMAVRIARESENDFLPELEAVSSDEFDLLFEEPLPKPATLSEGQTLDFKFRYLGAVTVRREKFYLFARLDPYEQAELRKKGEAAKPQGAPAAAAQPPEPEPASRPRRVGQP